MCEYYKILETSKNNFRIAKFSEFLKPYGDRPYEALKNVLEIIYYNFDEEDNKYEFSFRKAFTTPQCIRIEPRYIKEYVKITEEEYNNISNILKETRRVIPTINNLEWSQMNHYEVAPESTNTKIFFNVKKGHEIDKVTIYTEEYDEFYKKIKVPHDYYFTRKPIEININKSKYKLTKKQKNFWGENSFNVEYKFMENESTSENSVYKLIWAKEKKIPSTNLFIF